MSWILLGVSILLALLADGYVKGTYSKINKILNKKKISGQEAAEKILKVNGVNLYVVETPGVMSDHYDPRRKVIRLSKGVYNDTSVASLAIAAHEVGHALQDKDGYLPFKIRSLIAPVAGFASSMSYVVIMIGLIAGLTNLLNIGVTLLLVVLVFQLVTLPVEFDASKRAINQLKGVNLINPEEEVKVKSMLQAAAFTYVAAVITAVLEIVRLMLISRD